MDKDGWTVERVKQLVDLWEKGHSASSVAHLIGGRISRNAVIGKVHRMGLPRRRDKNHFGTISKVRQRKAKRPPPPPRKVAKPRITWRGVPYDPYEPKPETLTATKTIKDLAANDCRWPIGDPQEKPFGYCGREKSPGLPYCVCHARIAFTERGNPEFHATRKTFGESATASLKEFGEFVK